MPAEFVDRLAMGCSTAILQASELGAPVYRSMAFVDVGRYVQLEGPPAADRRSVG